MIALKSIFWTPIFFSMVAHGNSTPLLVKNLESLESLYAGLLFFFNFFSILYTMIKFYKFLCYIQMTSAWFPLLNPYQWPLSALRIVTKPYFNFWRKILPSIRIKKSSMEISGIIALEALNVFVYFCVRVVNIIVILLIQLNLDRIALTNFS